MDKDLKQEQGKGNEDIVLEVQDVFIDASTILKILGGKNGKVDE